MQTLQTHPRAEQIALAFDHAGEMFKESFREFAEDFYRTRRGKVEDVVALYKQTNLPKPQNDYRAVGGIIQKMVRSGAIRSVGTEKANDGSGRNMDVYAGAIKR